VTTEPNGGPERLEAALDHRFRDPRLLETALSHPSYSHETDGSRGNERLEFLGDAVLDLVVARLLYQRHPEWSEGELTRARSSLVNTRALASRARTLELGPSLKLGRTEQLSDGHDKDSILANGFEALVGALYLDGGLEPVEELVRRLFGEAVDRPAAPSRDAKTGFQEWAHARVQQTPSYRTVADSATENDERRFTVEVRLGGEVWGRGVGRSKRLAESAAARDALARAREHDG
jgi:ribonuclease-3